jgi:glycosyltransferase involved in cell wall biosynthesis
MKVVLVNYRYFISGGPERYLFNIKSLLEENKHIVVPFSVKHPRNVNSEFSNFFLSQIASNASEIYFKDIKKNPLTILKLVDRTFYSTEAKIKIERLIKHTKPDIAYLLHFLRWISPSIIYSFKRFKIPVVVRVSDFSYICPEGHLLREGKICELCIKGNYWYSVKHKCVQNSLIISLFNFFSILFHKTIGIFEKIDAIVCPSRFTLEKLKQAGFAENKLFHIPTFVKIQDYVPDYNVGDYILYFGRFSKEKGVDVLIDSFIKLKRKQKFNSLKLILVGYNYGNEFNEVKERAEKIKDLIVVEGLAGEELKQVIRNSIFTVVPSVCYDNLPNSILESYASGKPVIASNIGSFPEIVEQDITGLLFEVGNSDDLAEKMEYLLDNKDKIVTMGKKAREKVETEFSPQRHYDLLINLFNKLKTK